MTENTVEILLALFFAAALAFMMGWLCGVEICRRKNAEEKVDELYRQLENTCPGTKEQKLQFKQLRSVLYDAHKHIVAVSKALKIPTP